MQFFFNNLPEYLLFKQKFKKHVHVFMNIDKFRIDIDFQHFFFFRFLNNILLYSINTK